MGGRGKESEEGEMGKEAKGRVRREWGRERGGEGGGAEGTENSQTFLNIIKQNLSAICARNSQNYSCPLPWVKGRSRGGEKGKS